MDPTLHLVLRASFALLMGAAAWHKAVDLARFRAVVDAYELLPRVAVAPAALAIVALESSLAASLAAGFPVGAAGLAIASLMTAYAAAIHVNVRRGRTQIDCGCLGPAARVPLGGGLVLRNLLLAVAATMLALPVSPRPLGLLDAAAFASGVAALALCWQAAANLLALAPRAAALSARTR